MQSIAAEIRKFFHFAALLGLYFLTLNHHVGQGSRKQPPMQAVRKTLLPNLKKPRDFYTGQHLEGKQCSSLEGTHLPKLA